MDRPVSKIMEEHVVTADTEDTVERLEQIMGATHLSCVPVVDSSGECFGVVSAADLVLFHERKRNPKAVKAWEMCTYRTVKAEPDLPVREAARRMLDGHIHHLLVVSEGRRLRGIVSSLDIVAAFMRMAGEEGVRWR